MKNIISGISKCILGAGLIGAALLIWSNYDVVNRFLDGLKPEEYQTYKAVDSNISYADNRPENAEVIDIEEADENDISTSEANTGNAEAVTATVIDTAIDNAYEYSDANQYEAKVTDLSPNGSWPEAAELVKPSICRIKVGNYWGSGVIWHIEGNHVFVIANKHILDKSNIGYAAFYNGMNAAGEVKTISAQFDIGILDINISNWSNYEKGYIREVNISENCAASLAEGTQVFMLGSADGVASNVSVGKVDNPWYYYEYLDATYIYTHCKAKPGMSGGGCFDCHGHLVGIISGGNENTEETLCIPVQMLMEMGYR